MRSLFKELGKHRDQFLKGGKGKNLKIHEKIFRDDQKNRNFQNFELSFFSKVFFFIFLAEKHAGSPGTGPCGPGYQIFTTLREGVPTSVRLAIYHKGILW